MKNFHRIRRIFCTPLLIMGLIFTLLITLSFTPLPFYAYYRLSQTEASNIENADYIITYSAEGMPSPQTLMRIWTSCQAAKLHDSAKIIIAYPADSLLDNKSLDLIKEEYIAKGINGSRIVFENQGTNTYYQTLNICAHLIPDKELKLLIVTSPEYVYRTVACYRKLGYTQISLQAAYPNVLSPEKLKSKDESLGRFLVLRYNMWNYLKYEITVIREYLAIAYYKAKGWI